MSTPDPVMLRASGLGRRFGSLWAIRDVDLEVMRGEVVGLLGPNGAGKTTTVRLLTALIEPTEGSATVDGLDVREQPEAVRARVGILTETPGLYEKLSATANLDFFGRLYGLDVATRAERIERYLRLLSLWDRRDDVAGNFSKGMKQKLAIVRALLHEPAVVFLDEPTAALDPEAAYIVREAIEALRRSGRTIVLATHNLDEADRLCDRVAFVRGGLLRIDTPAGLRSSVGGHGVEVVLASAPDDAAALVAAARAIPGVTTVEVADRRLVVTAPGAADLAALTPALVRALVAAGAGIVGVHERVILTIAPLALAGIVGDRALPPQLATQVLAQRPEWAAFSAAELAGAFAVQQFLAFFLLMPAYIPLSIATFSIIGEKQARTLEPVLATPIRTIELLAGKAIAALVPGVLAGWVTYVAFVALASLVYGPNLFGVVTDASWLAGVFVLGPAVGLSSVVAGVVVSSRVNDPRVAQQIGGIIVVPIIAITLVQATGTLLVGPAGYLLMAAIVFVVSLLGLRVGVALFDREAILTRWR